MIDIKLNNPRNQRIFDEAKAKSKVHLFFKEDRPKQLSKLTHVAAAATTLEAHRQISNIEDDNAGVAAAHKSELAAETAVRQAARQGTLQEKASRLNRAATREYPEMKSTKNRFYQKHRIRKEYAAARKSGTQTAGNAEKAAFSGAETAGTKVREKVFSARRTHPVQPAARSLPSWKNSAIPKAAGPPYTLPLMKQKTENLNCEPQQEMETGMELLSRLGRSAKI